MVSHKELNDIVAQINKHFDSIFSRLEILEKMREILEGPLALKDTIPRIWEFKVEPNAITLDIA